MRTTMLFSSVEADAYRFVLQKLYVLIVNIQITILNTFLCNPVSRSEVMAWMLSCSGYFATYILKFTVKLFLWLFL